MYNNIRLYIEHMGCAQHTPYAIVLHYVLHYDVRHGLVLWPALCPYYDLYYDAYYGLVLCLHYDPNVSKIINTTLNPSTLNPKSRNLKYQVWSLQRTSAAHPGTSTYCQIYISVSACHFTWQNNYRDPSVEPGEWPSALWVRLRKTEQRCWVHWGGRGRQPMQTA